MAPKILIIDDNEQDRKVTEIVLKKAGYEDLVFAEKAQEGLDLACTINPALILLDINMPGEDGVSLHNKIKQLPQTKNIPIIFLSNLILSNERPGTNQLSKMDSAGLVKRVREIIGAK